MNFVITTWPLLLANVALIVVIIYFGLNTYTGTKPLRVQAAIEAGHSK